MKTIALKIFDSKHDQVSPCFRKMRLKKILENEKKIKIGIEKRDFKKEVGDYTLSCLRKLFPDSNITIDDVTIIENKKDKIGYTFPLFKLAKKLKIDVIKLNKMLINEQHK